MDLESHQSPPPPTMESRLARPKIYSENSFIVDEQLAEDECLCELCCDLIEVSVAPPTESDQA